MTRRLKLTTLILAGAMLVPGIASAATAFATGNVNLRAGPSTAYPAVNVVPAGNDVRVFGCLSNRSWCDVDYYGQRGWMSSNYLAFEQRGTRYTGTRVVERIAAPTVTFQIGTYWDDHYRDRSFYSDRGRYDPGYGRGYDRGYDRGYERDRREYRREARRDWREDRREWREDRRDWREDRRDWRDDSRRIRPGELVLEGRIN